MVGSFRGRRASLSKWTNREIKSKAEADMALDELTAAIRDGTFDERGLDPPTDTSPMTFGKFAEVYKRPSARSGCEASTCPGTTCGTSTRRGLSRRASRSLRSATCSGTHRSLQLSDTTTRGWRHIQQEDSSMRCLKFKRQNEQ
jgi:hypothetical protein